MGAIKIFRRLSELLDMGTYDLPANNPPLFSALTSILDIANSKVAKSALGSGVETALGLAANASGGVVTNQAKTFGSPTLASGWTDNGGGSYTCATGHATNAEMVLPVTGLTDGKLYLIRWTATAFSGSGNLATYLGATNSLDLFSAIWNQAQPRVFLAVKRTGSADQLTFRINSALSGSITITDIRVIELPF